MSNENLWLKIDERNALKLAKLSERARSFAREGFTLIMQVGRSVEKQSQQFANHSPCGGRCVDHEPCSPEAAWAAAQAFMRLTAVLGPNNAGEFISDFLDDLTRDDDEHEHVPRRRKRRPMKVKKTKAKKTSKRAR